MSKEFLLEILSNCYPEDEIFSTDLEMVSDKKVIITFVFPEYKRAKRNISYASVNQITPAIVEGMYVTAGNYIKNSKAVFGGFSFDDFYEKMWNAIFREFEKFTFLKNVPQGLPVKLTFELRDISMINEYYLFKFSFSGFARGIAKCLIPIQ